MDGVGEWATTSVAHGRGNDLQILREIHFPHSLGLFYSAFTYYTGFRVNSGEYKLMGLAPYGSPTFTKLIRDNLIDVKEDGSFRLNLDYFDYPTGLRMTNRKFDELFGAPPRSPESPLTQRHFDLAASAQAVLDDIVIKLTRDLARRTGSSNLCLAGGVALNCVANGKVARDGKFRGFWIQPAAGDAGGAVGAALAGYHLYRGQPRPAGSSDGMQGAYLGPAFSQPEIERRLRAAGARIATLPMNELVRACVDALESQKVLGWFQGRMEFGPRALGARSILADARSPQMQSVLNRKVKLRESFRPFAPAVLREEAAHWFDLEGDSPYMMLVADVTAVHRSEIPAVTHVDHSARVQTVHTETNPRFHALLTGFQERTGCPVLVNTSFNVRGEPIVCTPEEAFACFMATDIDALAVGDCFLRKEEQDLSLQARYTREFEPD
jgi:carbamoyltransferase